MTRLNFKGKFLSKFMQVNTFFDFFITIKTYLSFLTNLSKYYFDENSFL